MRYFVTDKDAIEGRIGPMSYELQENSDKTIAKAALLYASEPSRRPQEAMMFLKFCEKGLPKHPAVAYIRGLVQIRLGKNEEARKDLEYAAANGEGSVPAKAKGALAKLATR